MRHPFRSIVRRGTCLAALIAPLALATGAVAETAPMTFATVRIGSARTCGTTCPIAISATGQITENTPNAFLSFVEQNLDSRGLRAVVFLNSPGGKVLASMEFGTLLRKMGTSVVIGRVYPDDAGGTIMANGECFSACVYAFMGARKRVVPTQSLVGIHRMFMVEEGVDASGSVAVTRRRFDNGDMRAFLMRYSSDMGVSPGLIAAAEHVPSDSIRILSRAEMRRWHLAGSKL
jgi:hypothetical protein